VHKQLIAFALTVPLLLTACSSPSDSNPLSAPTTTDTATDTAVESASPQGNTDTKDACSIIEEMQLSLSTAVAGLIANPDLVTAFDSEFNNQIALLNDLIESLQGDSMEQQQLQTDLDAAESAKDDAVKTFNEAQKEDNVFSKTLGMADAALSGRDAVTAAEKVLVDLNAQLQCAP
jgi:hypothetical protein